MFCSHCDHCKKKVRKSLPSVRRKASLRKYQDGVKVFPDGRERCMTKAAWEKRKDEVFARAEILQVYGGGWWECESEHCGGDAKYPTRFTSEVRADFDVDHIRKRSLGRDDRLSNLQLLCRSCHLKKHDEFKKGARA